MKKLLSRLRDTAVWHFLSNHCTLVVNSILVFLLTLTMAYFPVTSFYLQVSHFPVVLSCVLFSVLFVYISASKYRNRLYIGAAGVLVLSALRFRTVLTANFLVCRKCIEVTIQNWQDDRSFVDLPEQRSATALIILTAALCAFLFSFVLVNRKSLLWTLFILAPFCTLSYCFSAPSDWCTALLVISAAVLLMTQRTRRGSAENGARLGAMLLPPVAMIFLIICAAFPQSDYDTQKLPYSMRYDLQNLGWSILDIFSPNDHTEESTDHSKMSKYRDINNLGATNLGPDVVMRVYAQHSGQLYLRGQTFSLYSDGVWRICESRQFTDLHFMPYLNESERNSLELRYISIYTDEPHDLLYTPYYATAVSAPTVMMGDSYLANSKDYTEYTVQYVPYNHMAFEDDDYYSFVLANCTDIDPELSAALKKLADDAGVTAQENQRDLPAAVRDYIRSAAEYDLNPDYPPEGSDPIIWFLTEGKRGYCTHYASACAAMLRALGIPARMVTGYCVNIEQSGWTVVREKHSHAWTEYYDPLAGWLPLDATGSPSEHFPEEEPETDTSASDPQPQPQPEEQEPEEDNTPTVSPSDPKQPSVFSDAQPTGVPRSGSDTVQIISDSTPQTDAKQKDRSGSVLRSVLSTLLFAGLFVLAVWLTNRISLRLRENKMTQGGAEARACACWEYITRLCSELDIEPSQAMRDIVMKAQFSRRRADEEDLNALFEYAERLKTDLAAKDDLPHKLIHQYILFLY